MSIEWLEAESAIDTRDALARRRAELEATVKREPANIGAALQLLSILDQLGEDPQAIVKTLDPAFQASPRDPALMAWLALMSYRLGELKLAMLTAKSALDADKGEMIANFVLAQVCIRAGQFNDAVRYAKTALEVSEASHLHKDVQRMYCIALCRLQRFDEAYKYQLQIVAARPDDSQAVIDTADLLDEMAKREDAVRVLAEAIERKPGDTDLLFRMAVQHFEGNNNPQALTWADRVIAADGQHLEGWNLRAQIKLKLGDATGALADHEIIRELSKKQPLDQAFRAECFLSMGRPEDAVAALKQGIAEMKDWPERRREYEAMLQRMQVQPPQARRSGPKLGPNEPCWCGSGKKLKKCHGA